MFQSGSRNATRVYVVKCEHFDDGFGPKPSSSRVDSVWQTWDSAHDYLNEMTGETMNGFGEWCVDVNPDCMEGDHPFDAYTIEESEMHG